MKTSLDVIITRLLQNARLPIASNRQVIMDQLVNQQKYVRFTGNAFDETLNRVKYLGVHCPGWDAQYFNLTLHN